MLCSRCAFDLRVVAVADVPTVDAVDRQTVEVPTVCYALKGGQCVPTARFIRRVAHDRERYRAGLMGWHELLTGGSLPVRHGKVTTRHIALPTSIECPLCHEKNSLPVREQSITVS